MSKDNQTVVFRRIHGRVIPIKVSKSNKEAAKGLAISGAGAAVAVGGASVYKRAVFKATGFAQRAFDSMEITKPKMGQLSFDDVGKMNNAAKNSQRLFRTAQKLSSFSSVVRRAAPALGGGLLFYGAAKVAQAKTNKKLSAENTAAISAIGGASLPLAIKQGQKLFEFGLQNRQVKMGIIKNSAIEIIKKYGTKFMKGL